MYIKYSVLVLG